MCVHVCVCMYTRTYVCIVILSCTMAEELWRSVTSLVLIVDIIIMTVISSSNYIINDAYNYFLIHIEMSNAC